MKKIFVLAAILVMAMMMTACKQSNITAEEEEGIEVAETKEKTTLAPPSTMEYTIPEGATGPADVKIEDDDEIPDEFKTDNDGDYMQVRYYYVNSTGLHEDFDVIEGAAECTPEALIDIMVKDAVLGEGTAVESFEIDGDTATLVLNYLVACSPHATTEQLAQAVANTFIDNLNLESVTVKESQGEEFETLGFAD